VHPKSGLFYVAEADHRVYGHDAINTALGDPDLKKYDREVLELPPDVFGYPRAPAGIWASCIRILNPVEVRRGLTAARLISLTINTVIYAPSHRSR